MNPSRARRVAWLLLGIAVVAVVAAVSFVLGANAPGSDGHPFMMGTRGSWVGVGHMDGFGGFGLLWMPLLGVVLLALFVVLFAVLFAPGGGPARPVEGGSGGLERLKELSEMHDRGALSDEEFTAAKRKLLGL